MPESTHPSLLSRRELLRRAAGVALLVGPGGALLSACATSGSDDKETSGGGKKSDKNPFGVKEDAALNVVSNGTRFMIAAARIA